MIFKIDTEYGVLVDDGGLLIPFSDLSLIEDALKKHQALNELEREALARRMVEQRYPNMVEQMNWSYFK